MENYINLLIINNDKKTQGGLKEVLSDENTNILLSETYNEGIEIISRKEIGIVIIDIDNQTTKLDSTFSTIKAKSKTKNIYILSLTDNQYTGIKSVKGLSEGAIDYITKPLNPNLIKVKIDIYKSLYFKDLKINQLLNNIFPENVLNELNQTGKFSPKRIENGVVLFTDFVNFSQKSKEIKPMLLVEKLEYYFNQFELILARYKLEKIKTIGDSFMVIGGVTETNKNPAIRACLAALEIRDFMMNEKLIAEALKKDFWEIRIGIHMGPLVAGIIGTTKMSFDVWGDTVNIASRAEQSSEKNQITITETVLENIDDFFKIENRGNIEIKKRGGDINMYFLDKLKEEFSLYNEGKIPNHTVRKACNLTPIDIDHMRIDILNKLKTLLPEEVVYHTISHTLNVEKVAFKLAQMEGLSEEESHILQTAVLYHDAGYIVTNSDNEQFAIQLAKNNLPKFGYNSSQIIEISEIISYTKKDADEPISILQKIMQDADHDYFGRDDYPKIAAKLRSEIENYGKTMSDKEWILYQLNYLENTHQYYTETSKNIRLKNKNNRIEELKRILLKIKD